MLMENQKVEGCSNQGKRLPEHGPGISLRKLRGKSYIGDILNDLVKDTDQFSPKTARKGWRDEARTALLSKFIGEKV